MSFLCIFSAYFLYCIAIHNSQSQKSRSVGYRDCDFQWCSWFYTLWWMGEFCKFAFWSWKSVFLFYVIGHWKLMSQVTEISKWLNVWDRKLSYFWGKVLLFGSDLVVETVSKIWFHWLKILPFLPLILLFLCGVCVSKGLFYKFCFH